MLKILDIIFTLALGLVFMFLLVFTSSMLVKSTTDHYKAVLQVVK